MYIIQNERERGREEAKEPEEKEGTTKDSVIVYGVAAR